MVCQITTTMLDICREKLVCQEKQVRLPGSYLSVYPDPDLVVDCGGRFAGPGRIFFGISRSRFRHATKSFTLDSKWR